jgi:hypothetical protein
MYRIKILDLVTGAMTQEGRWLELLLGWVSPKLARKGMGRGATCFDCTVHSTNRLCEHVE